MAMEVWETIKEAIPAYTGLSPATFFTILAISIVFYHVFSEFFTSQTYHQPRSLNEQESEPLPPPVEVGEISEDELKLYDGSDSTKPLLMAIKGQIYDVSQSRMFYGPGGPYALFAGKDASRALAKMSFEDKDLTGDISGLGPFELEALQDWEYKFMTKYVKVGTVKMKEVPVTDRPSASEPTEAVESTYREAPSQAEESPSKKPTVKTVETSAANSAKKED